MVRRIAGISPLVVAAATLVRLAGMVIMQYLVGMNLVELWHHWLMQLINCG